MQTGGLPTHVVLTPPMTRAPFDMPTAWWYILGVLMLVVTWSAAIMSLRDVTASEPEPVLPPTKMAFSRIPTPTSPARAMLNTVPEAATLGPAL